MSQKFFTRPSDIVNIPSIPPVNRRPIILIAVATILVLVLAFVVAGQSATSEEAATINQSSAIPYGNALELQYAQPYLSGQASAVNIPYSNALELQYARPWLNESVDTLTTDNALELQYARPWLNGQASESAATTSYSNALEMQYAQPWLNESADTPTYGNALEMQYAERYMNK